MSGVLITRTVLDGVSSPFEVADQITVSAYSLGPTDRVRFYIVGLSEVLKAACGCPPGAVQLPSVIDEMPLNCCGNPIELTRQQPWVVIDSPQGVKLRAKLEDSSGSPLVPTDQLVVYKATNTRHVNDRMRGCACAEE